MTEIEILALLRIQNGRLAEFKEAAEACMRIVKEKDTGTLKYEWFFNEDESICRVVERYKNSDLMLEHMGHLGEAMGQMLAPTEILSVELYGDPSPELTQALSGMNIAFFRVFQML